LQHSIFFICLTHIFLDVFEAVKLMLNNIFNALNTILNNKGPGQAMTLPHPEEPMNPSATLANTSVAAIIDQWFVQWAVPGNYQERWKNAIDIQVYAVYPPSIMAMGLNQDTPAATWEADGKRHMVVKPQWLNPGVVAHEQAHNSYAYLTPDQKSAFASLYSALKNTDPLIKLLYTINTYGLTNDVEGHAEVYRYIGQQMPEQLIPYYPYLF
jgi:hypothetical protein